MKQKFRHFIKMLQEKGLLATLKYIRGVYFTLITGIPDLKYSRVTPLFYVGPQYNKLGKLVLEKAGFTACVNMRHEFDDTSHGLALAEYSWPVGRGNNLVEHLFNGVLFLRRMNEKGLKTYIHCHSGIHRAPMLVIAYLISQGISAENAIQQMLTTRPFCTIDERAISVLKKFQCFWQEKSRFLHA